MTDIIFARPRHEYESYCDLWRLVEVSGYPLIFIDEINPDDPTTCYIFSSPDASLSWPGAKARIINWSIEWYTDYVQQPGIAETWHPDAIFAGMIGARYVPLGSDSRLAGRLNGSAKQYDVSHLLYMIPRRNEIITSLRDHYGLTIAPGGWGDDRHQQLEQSRLMLHIHQHPNIPALAPLRTAIAAAYKLPLFSESFWELPHLEPGVIIPASHESLAEMVAVKIQHLSTANNGTWLHEILCHDYRFGKVVEASV